MGVVYSRYPRQSYVLLNGRMYNKIETDDRISYELNGSLESRPGDLPAVESVDGYKAWYKEGEKHRDGDLPAVIESNGNKEWWEHGKLHRLTGPAVIKDSGNKLSWYVHGLEVRRKLGNNDINLIDPRTLTRFSSKKHREIIERRLEDADLTEPYIIRDMIARTVAFPEENYNEYIDKSVTLCGENSERKIIILRMAYNIRRNVLDLKLPLAVFLAEAGNRVGLQELIALGEPDIYLDPTPHVRLFKTNNKKKDIIIRPKEIKELTLDIIPIISCSICLDTVFEPVILQTGSMYCKTCISEWLKTSNKDPLTGTILNDKNYFPVQFLQGLLKTEYEKT